MVSVKKQKIEIPFILAFILPIFCGFGGFATNIVSVAELLILLYYLKSSKFWIISPVFYIYYAQLEILGETFFNFFIFLAAIKLIFIDKNFKVKGGLVWAILAMMWYAGIVLMVHTSLWAGTLFLIQITVSFIALNRIQQDEEVYRRLKIALVVICVSAALYGLLFRNIKTNQIIEDVGFESSGRYSGTMSDPNYMSFFYCLSFVTVLFHAFKKFRTKWILAILLLFAVLITGSITGLLVCLCSLLLYIFTAKEISKIQKQRSVLLICLGILLFVLYVAVDISWLPQLGIKERILDKLEYLSAGDIDNLTTGRTEYSQLYVDYLFNQNIFRILFGGYQLNAMGLIGEAAQSIIFAAHNTYIDVLMTCGVLGLVVFLAFLVFNLLQKISYWKASPSAERLSDIAYAIIGIIYIWGLSIFPGSSYMFFLFL